MSDRTQDLTNHRKVATACKNYTDTQIAQAKEEIYWHIGEYSVTTSDDNTSASVKTVPSNATRCKIKRVYGNTQKLNPTTASDSTSAMMKTMPSTVYDFDVSKVEGASEKSENLCPTATYNGIMNNTIIRSIDLGNLPNGTYTISINVIANTNNRTFVIYYYNNGVLDTVNNIITTINGTGQKSYTFTLDGTVTYDDLRFGINSSSVDYSIELENLMLNKGSTALPYQPYFEGIHNFAWNGVKVEGQNLFDKTAVTLDKILNATTGVISNDNNSFVSDYVEVIEGQLIIII